MITPCADPGIFVRGGWGPGQSDKSSDVFFFFFFSPQLILQKSNGQFAEKSFIFQGSIGGPTFSRGVQLFPGGSNCLFPIETHITCDFPGRFRTPCPPPSGSALELDSSLLLFAKVILGLRRVHFTCHGVCGSR